MKIQRIQAWLLRHIYEIWTNLDRKADIVFFPTIDLLTFGFLTIYINKLSVQPNLAGAILGGVIFWTLVYNIVRDLSFSLLEDAWSRNLYNLFATPLTIAEVAVGMLVLSVIKAAITTLLIIVLAYGLFGFNLLAYGGVIAFYIFSIFIFGWAFGFFTTSLIFRFGTRIQAVAWSLILILYPLSGVFYPLATLPPILARLARGLPISYIFEGFRNLILTGQAPSPESFALIVILNLIYLGAGIWFFTLGFKNAKRRGWFIHPS